MSEKRNGTYGKELAELVRKNIQRHADAIKSRMDRINEGWTDMDDCFLSQRVDERAIGEARMQLAILEGDGTMEIDAIFDEDGKEVDVRWANTRYGYKLVARGIWANSQKALLKKTGWTKRTIKVPCWTSFSPGSGGGMCAVYSGTYEVVRWHTNMVTGEYVGYPE